MQLRMLNVSNAVEGSESHSSRDLSKGRRELLEEEEEVEKKEGG